MVVIKNNEKNDYKSNLSKKNNGYILYLIYRVLYDPILSYMTLIQFLNTNNSIDLYIYLNAC